METSGQLSVIPKSEKRPVIPEDLDISPKPETLPITLVIDGRIISDNLKKANINESWLEKELLKSGVNSVKQILLATLDSHGKLYFQLKSTKGKL